MYDLPKVKDPSLVGLFRSQTQYAVGHVWDEVLEYRVWCEPRLGAPDIFEGDNYFHAFDNFKAALDFSFTNKGCKMPLALVLQLESMDEVEPGKFVHITQKRTTEWPINLLSRPRRTPNTIPDFLSPNAPANRMDILMGVAK